MREKTRSRSSSGREKARLLKITVSELKEQEMRQLTLM